MNSKIFLLAISLFLCFSYTVVAQKYRNYEVKVVTDNTRNIKGTLQKVTPEGVAIQTANGDYTIVKSANIVKIKVRKKGLKFGESTVAGAALGLGAGAAIFFSDGNDDLDLGTKLGGTALIGAVGTTVGVLVGLGSEIANIRVILLIDKDEAYFKSNYKKLLRYSKEGSEDVQ